MLRGISKLPCLIAHLVILPFALALSGTAVGQQWDLGPVPAVDIECLAVADGARVLPPDKTLDGSWRQFRGDRKLTGRSPLIGNITCPEWLWTIDLGARKHWVSITPGSGASQILLPSSGDIESYYSLRFPFEIDGKKIDLNGDGEFVEDTSSSGIHRVGDLLSSLPGFERVMCYPDFGSIVNRCYLHQWIEDENAWTEVWHVDLEYFAQNQGGSRPITGDFDNDGEMEVAILGWYKMHLVDLVSGNWELSGEFLDPLVPSAPRTGRAYGWFGAFDLDDDDKDEFIIMGDFEHFISVIGWENGQLKELWQREIDIGIRQNFARHHPGVNPVQDVDGDGVREVVTSIYNENDDNLWHVMIFDGATGDIKRDIPGAYLSGLGDVTGDGVAELLISETSGAGIPEFGSISVRSFMGGDLSVLWSSASEAFQLYDIPAFPDSVNSSDTHNRRSAFLRSDWNGSPVFMTRSLVGNGPDITLHLYQWSEGANTEIASVTGPRLKLKSMPEATPEFGILIQSITENEMEGPIQLTGVSGSLQLTGRVTNTDGERVANGSLLGSTVVNSPEQGGKAQIVTQNFDLTVRAFEIDALTPREIWRAAGRGWTSGQYVRSVTSINGIGSMLLADTTGSGDLTTIVATKADNGDGVIRNIGPTGNIIWEEALPTAGAPPVWNDAGITHWMAGNFTSNDHEDVLVSIRRQTQHNQQLHLLDGHTGIENWSITEGYHYNCERIIEGPGAPLMSIFDWNGDGLDDMLESVETSFSVFSGVDGSQLLERSTDAGAVCPGNPIFPQISWTDPLLSVADFLNNGSEQFLYGKNEVTMAVLELNGDQVWYTPFYGGMPQLTLQGIADIDGNGDLEIVAAGHCTTPGEEVRVYEADTGDLRWTMPMPESCEWPYPKALVSGDLDGNGSDEVYIMQGNVLHALAERNGNGQWLWRAAFGNDWAEFGVPVIGDVSGTGQPVILINHPDGYLYGLGQRLAKVVAMSDVNGNNSTDLGVLLSDADSGKNKLYVMDGGSGNNIRTASFGIEPVRGSTTVSDGNGDLIPEFGVLLRGSPFAKVKDVVNNTLLGKPKFDAKYDAVALLSVGDAGGGVGPDVAVVGREVSTGKVQAQVKDVASGSLVRRFNFSKAFMPFAAVAVENVGDSAAMEIAVLGIDASGNVQAQVKDAQSGKLINKIQFNKMFTPLFFAAVPNAGGKLKHLAVLGRNASGLIQAQVKRVSNGKLVSNVQFSKEFYPMAFISFPDSNGSGGGEIAVVGVNDAGKVRVQAKEIADGALVKVFNFSSSYPPLDAIAVNGVAGTGRNEIAVLGRNASNQHRLQIKDFLSGNSVKNIPVP